MMMRNSDFAKMLTQHLHDKIGLRAYLLTARRRWTPLQRSNICRGLLAGLVTTAELIAAHDLSEDEIVDWLAAYAGRGRKQRGEHHDEQQAARD